MDKEATYGEYLNSVSMRYNKLTDDEKDVIRSMRGTQQGLVISKVLGTDFALADLGPKSKPMARPKKRGLATR